MQNQPNTQSSMPAGPAKSATEKPGESIDAGKGRVFPCDRCGADLEFSIGQQSLECPYCGSVKQIEPPKDAPILEREYLETLDRLQRRKENAGDDDESASAQHAIRCDGCGADVVFQGTLTSTHCPYCASPLQRDRIHDSVSRIPVDGVLPFLIPQARAAENLRSWVQSLWWAPNAFLAQGATGKFNGVYLPFFTYDAMTQTRFAGQRGDAYFVTIGEGNNRRTERRVSWSYREGDFQQFYDDVLIIAASQQRTDLVQGLEPWPLERMISFTPEVLAGFFSRTYDVALEDGFRTARQRIEGALSLEVRKRIGGDEQSVQSQKTDYSAITFKHVLLPVWLFAYRYQDKTFQVMINAATGEVSGQRPYSWVKISFAVLLITIGIIAIYGMAGR